MQKIVQLFSLTLMISLLSMISNETLDYSVYHKQVIKAELLISSENYSDALEVYDELFKNYDFVFLRESQIATQLAFHLNYKQKAIKY